MTEVLDSELAYIPGQQTIDGDEVPAPAPQPEEPRVPGSARLEQFNLGGKLPTSATVTLAGGKVDLIDGQAFEKGETIQLVVTATITKVAQQDKVDAKTGIVMSCEQQHTARITDITVAS